MPGQLPEVFVGLGLLTLLAHAAWTDIRSRRIANATCLALVALWPLFVAVTSAPVRPLASIQVALAIFAGAALLWGRGWLGGGDVKLLSAMGLWAGPTHALAFLLLTGVAGGVLALVMLWHARNGPAFLAPLQAVAAWLGLPVPGLGAIIGAATAPTLPYGVAVAVGGGLTCLHLLAA
jgi:prepilin peptidase CpaA